MVQKSQSTHGEHDSLCTFTHSHIHTLQHTMCPYMRSTPGQTGLIHVVCPHSLVEGLVGAISRCVPRVLGLALLQNPLGQGGEGGAATWVSLCPGLPLPASCRQLPALKKLRTDGAPGSSSSSGAAAAARTTLRILRTHLLAVAVSAAAAGPAARPAAAAGSSIRRSRSTLLPGLGSSGTLPAAAHRCRRTQVLVPGGPPAARRCRPASLPPLLLPLPLLLLLLSRT
mmetsp:Transcript_27901/g.61205  ORF Transcript_27901/g.61205 Transcript_27901/m.61205 type:complete len:227 (-) Transcript_27901:326-1006(-)